MADRVGQQLGNYRLFRLLGEGSFAEVYLGEHIHLGTSAAIKVFHTQLTSDDADNFSTEAHTIARLVHPLIARVLNFDVEDKTPFLIMEYAPNGSLRQSYPRGTRVPLPLTVAYVKQVAAALQYAHDQHLIHRDIKPENMLIGRRNEILLSDFVISSVAQGSHYQSAQEMARTIAYMAPEQIQEHPLAASDQYALGMVVYEWLTGDLPFHGSFNEIATKHSIIPPPPLRDKVPAIPADVEEVVLTALAKDPRQRFATVQKFATAIEQATRLESNMHLEIPQITIFYSYAHEDEILRNELEKHLSLLKRQGRVDGWYDRNISAGTEWMQEINTHLNTASIILLLISPDYISSDYCFSFEMTRALERHNAKEAHVIPIILRPVDWQSAPFGILQALPPEGRPITSWVNHDEAFFQVTIGIRKAIQAYLQMTLPDRPPQHESTIERTVSLPPTWNKVGAAGPLIEALVSAQQWGQAEAEILTIPNRENRAMALELFTTALIEAHQWARAEAVARSVEDTPRKVKLLHELSRELAQAQEWGRAEAMARSIMDYRSRREALIELGHLLIQAGELARAREILRTASEILVPSIPAASAEMERVLTSPAGSPLPSILSQSLDTRPAQRAISERRRLRRSTYWIWALVLLSSLLIALVFLIWSKALTIPSNFVIWIVIGVGIILVIVVSITMILRIIGRSRP